MTLSHLLGLDQRFQKYPCGFDLLRRPRLHNLLASGPDEREGWI